MRKLLISLLFLSVIVPSSVESKPRCRTQGKVVVCRMPRPRKCTIRRPCIPRGYDRPNPPRYPMPTLPNPPFIIGG